MAEESKPWSGHAPDLVRDNQLMHERIAEQDREIERLRAALEYRHQGIERLRTVLAEAANRLGAHDSTCASYSTSDDDLVEHFEPKDCDCYLEGVTVETNCMRVAGPEASGEATGPEGDDSNMGTAPTSGPEATSSQGCPIHGECPICKALRVAGDPRESVSMALDIGGVFWRNAAPNAAAPTVPSGVSGWYCTKHGAIPWQDCQHCITERTAEKATGEQT